MRCLIVDDEEMSRRILESLLQQIEDLTVVAVCSNAIEAINILRKEEIDLIFLDIEMPEMSGMELVKSVPDLPQVVFVTSKKEYALEAFELHVTDYVHKPVNLARLLKAVGRARDLGAKVKTKDSDDIYLKVEGKLVRVDLKEVIYIESLGDYVVFNTEKKEKLIVHSTLKNIDDKITNTKFLKVHRSFIVNLSKIVDIQETNLVVKDKVIPISRAHKPALMNHIKML
jgi:DNA-binding LytR/AlgR family response regulator